MRICLYAHDWSYIDNYDPVIRLFESFGIDYEILVIKRNRYTDYGSYIEKYNRKYPGRIITIYDIPASKMLSRLSNIKIFGLIAETMLLIDILKTFLLKKRYSHILVSDDRIIDSCALLKAAKIAGVKNIILYPVEGFQIVDSLVLTKVQVEQYLPDNSKRDLAAKISKVAYRDNTVSHGNKNFYFYPPNEILRLKQLEIFPKNPWVRGANAETRIAVNSNMQLAQNAAHGINRKKMFVTGFPPHDELHKLLQNKTNIIERIKNALLISTNKKIFLIAGTNYSDDFQPTEHERLNSELSSILEAIINNIESDFEIIFKIHPRVQIDQQKNALSEHVKNKIRFVKEEFSVYELIAASDAILNFISASMDASLITDAPIFSYKIPGRMIFEEEVKGYKSITPVRSLAELNRLMVMLGKIQAFDPKLREEDRKNFGIFDGNNAQRVLQLITS